MKRAAPLAACLAIIGVAALGCGSGGAPEADRRSGRGFGTARTEGPDPMQALAPPPTPGRPSGRVGGPSPAREFGGAPRFEDEGEAAASRAEQLRESAEREESLSRSLAQAFGDPIACIAEETRDRLTQTLSIEIRAQVTPSGRVTRAAVSSGQLEPADRECLRERAEGIRLAGPIEDAPRTVSARVEYRVHDNRTREDIAEGPTGEIPRGTGMAAPALVLEGAGSVDERPRGSLAPSQTLERAGTVEGRPAGAVEPSLVLPATVEDEARPPGYVPPSRMAPTPSR